MTTHRNWKKWTQPILLPAAVFAAVALMLAIVTGEVRTLQDEVRHTQEVKDQLSIISVALAEGETAVRGYILSGNKALLEPYFEAQTRIAPALARLDELTGDNPAQQQLLSKLREPLAVRLKQFENAAGTGFVDGRVLPLPLQAGPQLQQEVRSIIAAMTAEEDRLLTQRREGVTRVSTYVQMLAYATLFAVVVVFSFSLARAPAPR